MDFEDFALLPGFVVPFLVAAAVSDDALILLFLSFFPTAALTLVVPLFSFVRDVDVLELLFMMMSRHKYRYL